MEADQVESLADMIEYCLEHPDCIYIREQVDGKWGSFSLAELPLKLRAKWMARWIEEGRVPLKLKKVSNAETHQEG